MNRLSTEKRQMIVSMLVEGNGINAISRMTGVSKNTVLKLLSDIGLVCSIHQDRMLRDLPCKRVEADEIWSFCHAKARKVPAEKRGTLGYGDVWTWVGMDADTKLVISYLVGGRTITEATRFARDLASRLRNRVQLTTDGLNFYLTAVDDAFKGDVDYAMLIKTYGVAEPLRAGARYSPGICTGIDSHVVTGDPDPTRISTSGIERQNLTMRMSMRRYTRLTNAHSKKLENHTAAVSLHFFHYNFCRPNSALGKKTTPAMAAGVTDHVWTLQELVGLLENAESVPTRRGSYRPRSDSK